ncbi:recombinase family protein [Sinorhizobium meliloti]|uniref:recombinase family protein n=1 Tax=Rhizobium meliloti TaxID=382 RepID=UPI001F2500EE|nr:recombinase family protein [Sinorhizobium meliloti]
MVAVMMFMRANEESEVKARRLREAWTAKRKAAGVKPMSAISPGWVRLREDRSGFDVIPERAAIVRRVFDMTLDGIGQHTIAMKLNREEVPVFGRGKMWQRSYINKMLQDPAVIGNFTPHRVERTGGKKVRVPTETIEGYFPAVVDRETFDRVMALSSGRAAGQRAPTANILAGLAKCLKCGSSMTRINKGDGKKGGKPYLICSRAKVGAGCAYRSVRLHEVEDTIRTKAFELLVALPSPTEGIQAAYEKLTLHRDVIGDEIERLVGAIAEAGHSRALLDRLRDMEAERDRIVVQLADTEVRLADTLTNRVRRTTTELVDATEEEQPDAAKVNAIMRQLFDRVTVDWTEGQLWFHWKHAPEEMTGIMYAWPKEE